MNAVNSINTTVLDGIIVGRVDPHIYAFSTETIPNYLKVGDTYRAVEVRLDEWRRHFPKLKRIYDHTARTDDKRIFRDYSVHTFLENERKRKRLTKNHFPKEYYSNEFFEKATKKDVEDAIADICCDAKRNTGKYKFYDENHTSETYIYERKDDYKPRKNQQETIDKFKVAIGKGRDKLLMYAVMRFGKSFTSMCCADEMNADLVVVVSAKADVKEEWKKTVESHKRFVQYEFATSENLKSNKKFISESKKAGKKIVLFLTLQDLQGKEMKDKHNELFKTKIDLLLVDESHFGARASEYGRVLQDYKLTTSQLKAERQKEVGLDELNDGLKVLKANVTMHLSGTPYRILMSDEFTDDDIVAFYQFSDIADDKEKWDKEHIDNDDVREWNNPYYGFPQMVRFAFNPCQSAVKKLNALKNAGVSYAMSELLKPQSISKDEKNNAHQKFVHAAEVLDLFKVIDGSKTDENVLGFLDYDKIKQGQMCRHIVIVLPFRASCDALEKMITNNKKIFKNLNDYQIVNIAGVDGDKTYKDIKDVKNKIQTCEAKGQKTITLTVNRMLTGSTVEQWDTMIYLKDTESPQEYDQAIFRLQNPYIKVYGEGKDAIKFNMKPQTLLVDFDVNRVFRMQEQKSQIYNVNTDRNGNSELEKRIRRELEISPIIVLNKNKLQKVEPVNVMDAVREYSRSKSVADEAASIPTDLTLLENESIRAAIEKLNPIDAKQGLEIKPNENGDGGYDIPDAKGKNKETPKGLNSGSLELTDDGLKELKKKLATYYAQILFYAFLTDSKVTSLTDIITDINKNENNRRICKNVGLNKNILELTQKYSNHFVLSQLDYKIHNINTLISDEKLKPIERVEAAMRKFGRLGTSEIVTPARVADEMVALLPEKEITSSSKILDIATKQGEFTCALYRRFGEKVRNNVYAIPTSPITYEFTRKVYGLLNMPIKNIFSDFTSYDLFSNKKESFINKLKDMNFNAIVGNPPYQETLDNKRGLAKQLFPDFVKISTQLKADYVSLITPLRWFTAEAQDGSFIKLREYFKNNRHFQKIYSYPNSKDVFREEIAGGVNFFLYADSYCGDTEFHVVIGGKDTVSKRPLFEKDIDIVIYDDKIYKIIEHLRKVGFSPVSSITTGRDAFGIVGKKETVEKISDITSFDRAIEVRCAHEEIRYISRKNVTKSTNYIDKWKVFTSKANGGAGIIGDGKPVAIIGKAYIGKPGSVCTDSLLPFGCFSSKDEAENLKKYMKTKFFRLCVGILKTSQNLYQNVYQFVPLQDFTAKSDIDWSKSVAEIDKQLYKKYGLSEEEIGFVEGMIKEME